MTTDDKAYDEMVAGLFADLRKPLPPLPKVQGTRALVKALGDRPFVIVIDNSGSMETKKDGNTQHLSIPALMSLSLLLTSCPKAVLEVSSKVRPLMDTFGYPTDIVSAGDMLGMVANCDLPALSQYMKDNYPPETVIVFITDGYEDFTVPFEHELWLLMANPDLKPPPTPKNPYAPWFKRAFNAERLNI